MPSGIILSSGSVGATQEDIEKVLTANGYEPEKPEPKAEEEPKEQPEAKVEAEKDEAEEQEESKKPSRFQRRVERETKELRDEIKRLRQQLDGKDAKKEPEPKINAPQREDFKSDAEYDDALFDYRYQMRRAKEEAENAKKTLEAQLEANFNDYKASVADFREDHDDWDEVVNDKVRIPESVYYAIVDLGKDGPPVSYHLGQHPEIVSELADMTPYRAAIEIGRLADKLKGGKKAESSVPPKPKPKLPEPVKPVSASATSSTLTSAEAAKARDFRAFKAAQRQGR